MEFLLLGSLALGGIFIYGRRKTEDPLKDLREKIDIKQQNINQERDINITNVTEIASNPKPKMPTDQKSEAKKEVFQDLMEVGVVLDVDKSIEEIIDDLNSIASDRETPIKTKIIAKKGVLKLRLV